MSSHWSINEEKEELFISVFKKFSNYSQALRVGREAEKLMHILRALLVYYIKYKQTTNNQHTFEKSL